MYLKIKRELTDLKRETIGQFVSDVSNGKLASGAAPPADLQAIDRNFFAKKGPWDQEYEALGNFPPASPGGPQHNVPNDRTT